MQNVEEIVERNMTIEIRAQASSGTFQPVQLPRLCMRIKGRGRVGV